MSKRKQSGENENIQVTLDAVERTAEGLRDALFDELNLLRAGKVGTAHARAVSNLCRNIIESAKLEIYQIQMLNAGKMTVPLQLGTKFVRRS